MKKYNELETEHDDIKHLIEKYNEFEAFLEKDIKDPPNLHSSEKKAILLSAFNDFKKISQQLAEVENLKKLAMEKNPIKGAVCNAYTTSNNYVTLFFFVFFFFLIAILRVYEFVTRTDLQQLENNVSNIEINTQDLLLATVDFKKDLEKFLTNYNDLVYLISQKFLQWDAILTDMEKRFMNRNRQKHESEPKTFTQTDSHYAAN